MVENKKNKQDDLFSINESFGNALEYDELEKVSQYYTHEDGWSNRLIQGDSLLSMTSLLERENMAYRKHSYERVYDGARERENDFC